ncbi:putative Heat shock protein 70 family [Rosa chinensis]|uniref:Putative Heat shock protein 70 family n=1 Tax=Rosa chinensis TaxID=74649 RepID=A0A2P6PIK8_ROSCH|nr:putative Heat shock protein 70 family [Rosa chinensis]
MPVIAEACIWLFYNVFKGKKLCQSINPDEAVAHGAAVHAAVLSGKGGGKLQDFTLLDATPVSLGVEVGADFMGIVIPRNTKVPVVKNCSMTTRYDNQVNVIFAIYEGESETTLDNNFLGEFWLRDIPPAPKGVPKFNVCFNIDADGILSVSAKDKYTGKKNGVTINSNRTTFEGIEKMS